MSPSSGVPSMARSSLIALLKAGVESGTMVFDPVFGTANRKPEGLPAWVRMAS